MLRNNDFKEVYIHRKVPLTRKNCQEKLAFLSGSLINVNDFSQLPLS